MAKSREINMNTDIAMADNYLCDDSVYTRYVVYRTAISIAVYC